MKRKPKTSVDFLNVTVAERLLERVYYMTMADCTLERWEWLRVCEVVALRDSKRETS